MKPPESIEEADVAWTEERTIALMHDGVPFVDACEAAARECTERVLRRRRENADAAAFDRAVLVERERRRAIRETEGATARAAEPEAKAAQGRQPTLHVSLGDLLRKRTGAR